jgi:hypothetical protein
MSMRSALLATCLGVLLVHPFLPARAQSSVQEVAIITLVSGPVSMTAETQAAVTPKPFSRVRVNDQFDIPAGSSVRIVYLKGGRAEVWNGRAQFRAGSDASQATVGAPEITALPNSVRRAIVRAPDAVRTARLGGINIRSLKPANSLADIRNAYLQLRKELPEDDVTPELFLFSATAEYLGEAAPKP